LPTSIYTLDDEDLSTLVWTTYPRNYDISVARFINLVYEGSRVPRIFSTPERAFATALRALRLKATESVPLPMVSISSTGPELTPEYRTGGNLFRHIRHTSDGKSVYGAADSPTPARLRYDIELWCRNRLQKNHLMVQFINLFNRFQQATIPVDHGDYGVYPSTVIELSSITEASNYEPEAEDIESRMSFQVEIAHSLIHRPGTYTPLITDVGVVIGVLGPEPEEGLSAVVTEITEFTANT